MENRILLFFTGCFTLLLSSCLGSDDNNDYVIGKNCQISAFSMTHDSISGLSTTQFTIDQLNGRIFNTDSLPYGTKVDKVVLTVSYASSISVGAVQVIQEAVGDTIYWNSKDSLDYSKPVTFIITAYDGVTKKVYDTRLNVHQIEPDSMVWSLQNSSLPGEGVVSRKVVPFTVEEEEFYYMYTEEPDGNHLYVASSGKQESWLAETLTGLPEETVYWAQLTEYEGLLYVPASNQKLYRSGDGKNWTAVSDSPTILALLGAVKEETTAKKPSALAVIATVEGSSRFACMDKSGVWYEGNAVPEKFPMTGFAPLSYNLMYRERLLLAGGKTKDGTTLADVWATMDGVSWALTTSSAMFTAREGAAVAKYDTAFFMIGGLDAEGKALKDIYRSIDNGLSWIVSDTLVIMPEEYNARGYSSMIVDNKTNYMYLFGGKGANSANDSKELWRGRINRLGFGR
ncbi:MAG: DUF6242 domain-containing protein [Massilibacteroides sp.]|nr:DUF6242 domain-containing protein [Massilibacteroides sp.]MDD3062820.1 DUF6242 domain-containing protein [Massilibacteroides sp.]MDD4115727.1 DUF6242 domain-containing protein [Massilibacteroides sp.]MDD4659400.1 DUF6242 domain-containing protein [Massilibacteroides sp.]